MTLSMKLIIDKKTQRLLFAEASKDVVDFLFSFLALPVATAVKLIGKEDMVGCVSNIYASVEKLQSTYVQPGAAKDALLLSPTVLSFGNSLLRLPGKTTLYRCPSTSSSKCRSYVTTVYARAYPSCGGAMATAAELLPASGSGWGQTVVQSAANGFVQGIVTYAVTDNLTVTPMSAASTSITLLSTLGVKDVGDLQEKTVQLGYNEGLAVLKASLQSKTVLTDVFFGDKKAHGGRA
ncbi:unnamed protein product [Urochloa decumbens]|uniref:DUF674 family protein n=1 Tax=Urochloa decumbens TaxID=240449 RepID=A0ABC8ZB56_9POAL